TLDRRHEYLSKGAKQVAKFMPCFNRPYRILVADPMTSFYTLKLPTHSYMSLTFHVSQLQAFIVNDPMLFPTHVPTQPKLVLMPDGKLEHHIDHIIEEQYVGHGKQYLVCWSGFGPADNEWLSWKDLDKCKALDIW
ncbi:hypothetical protein L210DRAFT_3309724, partial [Boletus edulis BED1]